MYVDRVIQHVIIEIINFQLELEVGFSPSLI